MLLIHAMTNVFQAALFSAVAAVAAPETEVAGEDNTDEVSERDSRLCSASNPAFASGRELAKVTYDYRTGNCVRTFLGVEAPQGTPSCWDAGKELNCGEIIDMR